VNDPQQQSANATASRKPGLLTEDRNSVTRTNDSGEQRIVKVPSRADEAARRGVDESHI